MANDRPKKKKKLSADDPEALEKIVDHFTSRLRAGKHPSIAEYQEKFPSLKDEIEDLLASVAMIEKLKPSSTSPEMDRRSLEEVSGLKRIGNYEVVGEIGRGGMGIVFEAIHESLGRRVAIKVMPTPLVNRSKYIERFQREAKAAAKLHHTNIVSVFGVGEGDGFHYYVMDFVDGQTLGEVIQGMSNSSGVNSASTQRVEGTRLEMPVKNDSSFSIDEFSLESTVRDSASMEGARSKNQGDLMSRDKLDSRHFRWAARLGANLADALSYAHSSRILHRDIKPSNLILDRKGVVWITDFGLAKDSSNEVNLTKTGDVIGTPQYLAPESLEGKYDRRSEVYCLGLTLYELATLQPAYAGGTTAEIIRAIASTSPVSPRKVNSKVPIDLSTIIEKSISREPEARYATANQLRSDLLAFVDGRPISARPPSAIENIIKWSRRNPLPAALSAVSALLLILVTVSASIGYLYTVDALGKEAQRSEELVEEQEETEKQRKAAVAAAEKMEVQYKRAEANIEITLEAFDEMFMQIVSRGSSSTDLDIEGFEELMGIETSVTREDAAFLEKLLAFYDRFATENEDNEALRLESAKAFRRAANIYQLVGQYDLSVEAYKKAIFLYELIWEQSDDSKEILISLVQSKSELARGLRRANANNWPEAVRQNDEAIQLLEDAPLAKLDSDLKLELAKTYNSLGSSKVLSSVLETSGADLRSRFGLYGFGHRGAVGRGGPGGIGGRPPRRAPGESKGGEPRGGRRPPSGLRKSVGRIVNQYSRESLKLLDELVEMEPSNSEFRSARVNAYCSLAATYMPVNPEQARKMRALAIKELEWLNEQDSGNPSYRFRLAMACMLSDFSNPTQDELNLLNKSLELSKELTEKFPQVPDYHSLYGSVRNREAGVLIAKGALADALASLQLVDQSFNQVNELQPMDRFGKSVMYGALASQLRMLAEAADKQGEKNVAREARSLIPRLRQNYQEHERERR